MKTLAVFFGGNSNEHEISVITGLLAVNLLRDGEWKVLAVYLPREGGMKLTSARSVEDFRLSDPPGSVPVRLCGNRLVREGRARALAGIDCALNCCHGGAGENGTLSALLCWNGVPCASPDLAPSAIFMNKEYSKIAARGLGIGTARSVAVREGEKESVSRIEELGYPVVVKPSSLGSSIGVKVAADRRELEQALNLAFELDDGALVEEYLPGKRDINCAACRIDGEICVSDCEEVFSDEKILTFSEKYEGQAKKSELPARLSQETAEKIKSLTRLLYGTFRLKGVVRADFILSGGEVYFNELNTVPGSLALYLFGRSLSEGRAFLKKIVCEALKPQKRKKTVVTGILGGSIFSGGKGCKRR